MTKYTLNTATKEKIKEFISPFVGIDRIIENEELSNDEMNMLLSLLGKFPAAVVYPIIEDLRTGVNTIENAGK